MENSTKALLMAGGVLLTMLIVLLLFYFKGRITEFYDNQGRIDDIANVAEFNKQFTNYERQKVYGYEIISLANMVEDYNTRHSGAQNAPNDEKYTPITLTVSFVDNLDKVESQIWYNNNVSHLFCNTPTEYTITQSDTLNQFSLIINRATNTEAEYGDTQIASKLAKSISKLIVDEENESAVVVENLKKQSEIQYKLITNEDKSYEEIKNIVLSEEYGKISVIKYYEYVQFKRAVFKCTGIGYDNDIGGSGRITSLDFSFIRVE